jgi:hypothetical protein
VTTSLQRDEHGVTGWRLGCRCPTCRTALRRHAQVWWATRRLRAGADPASRVPVTRLRRHIAVLRAAGLSQGEIARRAAVAPSTITRVLQPGTKRASRIVAAAVLAVEP